MVALLGVVLAVAVLCCKELGWLSLRNLRQIYCFVQKEKTKELILLPLKFICLLALFNNHHLRRLHHFLHSRRLGRLL